MAVLDLNLRPVGIEHVRRGERALHGMKRGALETEGAVGRLNSSMAFAFTAIAAAATAFAGKSVAAYRIHNKALAEVSTLLSGSAEEMDALDAAAKRFAATFGGSATEQVNAFYQAISAGVGDVADATKFMETANKLALGGVTDITTSVDLLTTVTNAYASSGLEAAQAADILFTGVKAGKTTIGELSSALGQIVPISSSVGIGLDQVVSGVAALTTQGQSTSQAVTGLRAALSAVIKPTSEAQKLAKALGIEFNTTALRTKGLGGFIAEIAEKTGGSKEAMAQLFGSVEALNAVLALTGDAGDVFDATMGQMATSAGAAQTAADKVADSLENRLSVQFAILSNAGLAVGQVLLGVIVPAMEFATSRTSEFGAALTGIGAAVSFVFPIIGAVTALAGAISYAAANWDHFKAVGEVALDRIKRLTGVTTEDLAILWTSATDAVKGAWELLGIAVGSVLNKMIGATRAAYTIFTELFPQLPKVVGSAVIGAVNSVIGGIESMVQAAIDGINSLISGVNSLVSFFGADKAAEFFGFSGKIGELGDIDFGRVENPLAGAIQDSKDIINSAVSQIGEDYVGEFFDGFDRAVQRRKGENADILDPRRGVFVPEKPSVAPVAPDASTVSAEIQKILDELGSTGGSSGGAASKVDNLVSSFDALMASLEPGYARSLKMAEGLKIIQEALDAEAISAEEAASATELLQSKINDGFDLSRAQQGFTGFFKSILTGAQSATEALADLAARAADRLLTNALDRIFESLGSINGVGGDNFLTTALGFLFSANGNVFNAGNVVPFANGTVVGSPTFFPLQDGRTGLMGEAGPEAIMPLKRGPGGKLGVEGGGGQQKPSSINILFDRGIFEEVMRSDGGESIMVETMERSGFVRA